MNKFRNYVFFMLYLVFNPRLLFPFLRGIYLPSHIQYEWLKKYKIRTIIDVGAFHGHVSQAINYMFPKADFYLFEPISENCEYIKKILPYKNVIVEKIALSDKIGILEFYKNKFLPASSLLGISKDKRIMKNYPYTEVKKINVVSSTLDEYFSTKKLNKKIFLKIDVQGAEGLVLKGGKNLLKQVSLIYVETAFNGHYERESHFSNVYDYLTRLGFKYLGEVLESEYFPLFELKRYSNAVFIKKDI